MILLDTRNRVLHIESVYRGSVNTSQGRVGELFRSAVRRKATALVVVHSHPSGDPTPSLMMSSLPGQSLERGSCWASKCWSIL